MNRSYTRLVAVMVSVFSVLPASAAEPFRLFGWGAPLERTQKTLGRLVSAPRPCMNGWMGVSPGCQAVVIARHRIGQYDYRLELQHHPEQGLQRIVMVPVANDRFTAEQATAYAILIFDAAFSESHRRLVNSPQIRTEIDSAGKPQSGYEWLALYGSPRIRVRLHAWVGISGKDDGVLAIEGTHPGK